MRAAQQPGLDCLVTNRHLIAQVQIHAGCRCHEAANLLHCYTSGIDLYSRLMDAGELNQAAEVLELTIEAETNLRRFLFNTAKHREDGERVGSRRSESPLAQQDTST